MEQAEPLLEITTKLLDINALNLNARYYSLEAAEKMVELFNNHTTKIGEFYGSIGYAEKFTLNLKEISHKTKNVWIDYEDNSLWGTISILNNEKGKLLSEMIKSGEVVFRARSKGRVNLDKSVEIQELISFDAIPQEEDAFGNIPFSFTKMKGNGNR